MDKAKLTQSIIDTTNAAKRGVRAHKLRETIREGFVWDALAALIDALLAAEAEWPNAEGGVA